MRRYGIPEEILTDNGKQFTDRFGRGGEVLFDRICRENAITHRLTQPRSPTTTGKIERFHQSLRRELLNDHPPFASVLAVQAAVDTWITHYNCDRPHQGIDDAYPVTRFTTGRPDTAQDEALPLRIPAILAPAAEPEDAPADNDDVLREDATAAPVSAGYRDGPVEFERVVPPSGNLGVLLRRRHADAHGPWVFPSTRSTLRDPDNTRKRLREVVAGTEWEGLHPHAFRHLVATRLDAAGLSAREIADYLGHERVSMTQDVYMSRKSTGAGARAALQRFGPDRD